MAFFVRFFLATFLLFSSFPVIGQNLADQAIQHLHFKQKSLGLEVGDLSELVLTDQYESRHSGLTHLYFQQQYEAIDIFGAVIGVHLHQKNGVIPVQSHRLQAHLSSRIKPQAVSLSQEDALGLAISQLALPELEFIEVLQETEGEAQEMLFHQANVSLEPIPVRLVYQADAYGELQLAWSVRIYPTDAQSWQTLNLSVSDGEVLASYDWVHREGKGEAEQESMIALPLPAEPLSLLRTTGPQYEVYAFPMESPAHGSRSVVSDPSDALASPYGWHDTDGIAGAEYTTTNGNNIDAYADLNNNNFPTQGDDDRAEGGGGANFSFGLDLTQAPATYVDASLTNLFYWGNVLHDLLYQYGFDEGAGNFQQNNYGRGGAGNDVVRAEAQDGAGVNDASFACPPDGYKPRMQLYPWTLTTPQRAGELDNGIIIHEYAHGLSNRLVGGPSNAFCLLNGEQMGEGWSDWLAMTLTMKSGDLGTDLRALGTYAMGQNPGGAGNRLGYYTTDFTVNDFTYDDLKGLSTPYGTGYGWASILWDVNWALIDKYGFDPDWYDGSSGNQLALQLVIDGMKLTPCNPGFVDARDAILAADLATNSGDNMCILWEVFARRGLGYSAKQGNSYSHTDGQQAFDLPPSCIKELSLDVQVSPDSIVSVGDVLTITGEVRNQKDDPLTQVELKIPVPLGTTYVPNSASHGGTLVNDSIHFPALSLPSGSSMERSFQVTATSSSVTNSVFEDYHESGTGKWSASHSSGNGDWSISATLPFQGNYAWYAQDVSHTADQYLTLSSPIALTDDAYLQFWHRFDTEAGVSTAYDGGVVEISIDGGLTWQDLGSYMKHNGYQRTISSDFNNPLSGRSAFGGNSNGYIRTDVDLSTFGGNSAQLRFRLGSDSSVGGDGWYIDGVRILDLVTIQVEARVSAAEGDVTTLALPAPGIIIVQPGSFPVEWTAFEAIPDREVIQLRWSTASETNNAGFKVQRSLSSDFTLSNPFAWVQGAGNSLETNRYDLADEEVLPGLTYFYRLKQIDLNGRYEYSSVVSARLLDQGGIDLLVYPNPSIGQVAISLFSRDQEPLQVFLVDALGNEVRHQQIPSSQERQIVRWELGELPNGVYLIHVRQGAYLNTQRVLLQR